MDSVSDTHRWVGFPIRISTDQSLLAAPRGFSQRATSFIASWCQGIHRMPFSYSIQCPSAEADRHTMHRNHPQTVQRTTPGSKQPTTPTARHSLDRSWQEPIFAHNRIPSGPPLHPSLAQQIKPPTKQDRSHASEPSPPTTGALIPKDSFPGQTCSRTTGPTPILTDQRRSHAPRDAPEPDSP